MIDSGGIYWQHAIRSMDSKKWVRRAFHRQHFGWGQWKQLHHNSQKWRSRQTKSWGKRLRRRWNWWRRLQLLWIVKKVWDREQRENRTQEESLPEINETGPEDRKQAEQDHQEERWQQHQQWRQNLTVPQWKNNQNTNTLLIMWGK